MQGHCSHSGSLCVHQPVPVPALLGTSRDGVPGGGLWVWGSSTALPGAARGLLDGRGGWKEQDALQVICDSPATQRSRVPILC